MIVKYCIYFIHSNHSPLLKVMNLPTKMKRPLMLATGRELYTRMNVAILSTIQSPTLVLHQTGTRTEAITQ